MFISHRMDEVFAIADRIAVLKDGRNSGEVDRADAERDDIVRMMVGRDVESQFPLARRRASAPGRRPPALRAVDFGVAGTNVAGIDLTVYAGEVCGLAGLQGQGQTILLEGLFGLRRATGRCDVGRHRGRSGTPAWRSPPGWPSCPRIARPKAGTSTSPCAPT